MQLTPLIAFHMSSAIAATSVGALTLWARRSGSPRPLLHRIAGYAFVLLMLGTAISALFIRDFSLPNWSGFTPIHLLVPVTLGGLGLSFWHLAHPVYNFPVERENQGITNPKLLHLSMTMRFNHRRTVFKFLE